VKSIDGIANLNEFRKLGSLNLSSELVSDNDFRSAVNVLNHFRLRRAENLGYGYDVSKTLCYNFDATSSVSNSVSRSICFHTNYQQRYSQIHGRFDVSAMTSPEIVDNVDITLHTGQHPQSIITW
jgi:hypothetical protein